MSVNLNGNATLYRIAERLAKRLGLWKKMAEQAKERGEENVILKVEELFEPEDASALSAFERVAEEYSGQRPLPMEGL